MSKPRPMEERAAQGNGILLPLGGDMGTGPICKGHKDDGSPCRYYATDNGYCHVHQDQARAEKQEDPDVSAKWTRERLEAAIDARGGSEGLDLSSADLSDLDLSGMDLHGTILARWLPDYGFYTCTRLDGSRLCRANLSDVKAQGAALHDLDLTGAKLGGADLRKADLSRAILRGARLWKAKLDCATLEDADLRQANLWHASFCKGSLMGADMRGTRFRRTNLAGADLVTAKLQETVLLETDLTGADLTGADLRGANLGVMDQGGLSGARLRWARLDRTRLARRVLGSQIGEEAVGEYRDARDVYMALKQDFESLGDYGAASWAYVKECRMEAMCSHPRNARRFFGAEDLGDTGRDCLPNSNPRVWWFYLRYTMRYLGHLLVDGTCGYGESWLKTLRAMGITFVLFAAIYWLTWAVVREMPRPSGIVDLVPTRNPADVLLFSAGAFTTMDPKGVGPIAPWVQFVATVEALLGIGLTGLLGFVLGNRIRRS